MDLGMLVLAALGVIALLVGANAGASIEYGASQRHLEPVAFGGAWAERVWRRALAMMLWGALFVVAHAMYYSWDVYWFIGSNDAAMPYRWIAATPVILALLVWLAGCFRSGWPTIAVTVCVIAVGTAVGWLLGPFASIVLLAFYTAERLRSFSRVRRDRLDKKRRLEKQRAGQQPGTLHPV
jgi:hypothetical protein